MRQIQPQNIGTERIIIVHFFPYLGISQPERGPAVKAPKLRSDATQLCCSRSSLRREAAGQTRLGRTSGCRESCGRAGADQDRTVPSPKEPRVANNVAGIQIKVRSRNYVFVQLGHCVTTEKYTSNTLHNFIISSFFISNIKV